MLRRATLAAEGREPRSGSASVNRARSCASVSRIRAVISWECSRALVKILGGGNLQPVDQLALRPEIMTEPYGSSAIAAEDSEICSRWFSKSVIIVCTYA